MQRRGAQQPAPVQPRPVSPRAQRPNPAQQHPTAQRLQPVAPQAPRTYRRDAPAPSPYASQSRGKKAAPPTKPKRSARDIASYVLIAVGVALLLVSGGLFLRAQMGYKQASEFYEGLNGNVLKDSDGEGIPVIDFDALKQVNEDVVGWIYIPGTNINYVVAQGETNDTYLRHLINGEYNANGTVFMDMDDVTPGLVDQQTTLYGHHMNDGSMFSYINDTVEQPAFDTIKKVYYITPEATYELKPLFTMKVEEDYVDARVANFENDEAFRQYLKASLAQAKAHAADAGEQVEQATEVMTLITCDDAFLAQTKRAAMVCALVGEVGAPEQAEG